MDRIPLLYDEDCGVCRTLLGACLLWDRRERLRPVPLQSPEADLLLAGMPEDRRMRSWHLATADGVRSGGAAFPGVFGLLPGGRPLGWLSARAPLLFERGYRLVADNRSRLSALVPRTVRDRADALIVRRSEGSPLARSTKMG